MEKEKKKYFKIQEVNTAFNRNPESTLVFLNPEGSLEVPILLVRLIYKNLTRLNINELECVLMKLGFYSCHIDIISTDVILETIKVDYEKTQEAKLCQSVNEYVREIATILNLLNINVEALKSKEFISDIEKNMIFHKLYVIDSITSNGKYGSVLSHYDFIGSMEKTDFTGIEEHTKYKYKL